MVSLDTLLNGIAVGGAASLLAIGITQVFGSTGVLSFAQAGFALLAAYAYVWLYEQGWMLGAAAVAAVGTTTLLGALTDVLVFRRLASGSSAVKIVVTIGLYTLMQGIVVQLFGFKPKNAPLLVTGGIHVGDAYLSSQQLLILLAALGSFALLQLFMHKTRAGLVCRATAQDSEIVGILGISTRAVSTLNWTIGAAMAGIAGVLLAPLAYLTMDSFGIYIVGGITAALFGGLVSLGGALVGGLVLGVVQSYATIKIAQPGTSAIATLGTIVVLLVVRRRWPRELTERWVSAGAGWRGSRAWLPARIALAALWGLLLANAARSGFWAYTTALVLVYVLLALALILACGWTGQLSLGHGALVGLGTFGMVYFAGQQGLSFGISAVLVSFLGLLGGLVFGGVSLRLASTQVAIVTLALSMAASGWLFVKAGSARVESPGWLGSDHTILLALLLAVATCTGLLARLRSTIWGIAFLASRDEPEMAAHFDVSVRATRLWGSGIAGLMAALAGIGLLVLVTAVPPFVVGVQLSLSGVVFAFVGGIHSLSGAFIGPLLFIAGPQVMKSSQTTTSALPQILGGLMVLVVVLTRPDGLATFLRRPGGASEAADQPNYLPLHAMAERS